MDAEKLPNAATPPTCGRDLTPYPLPDVFNVIGRPGAVIVTMSIGQWDGWLSAAYATGCILLELDDDEIPVRAYRKRDSE